MTKRGTARPPFNVGIVGAGVAGLYAALLLQRENSRVTIFETNGRVGGRIYTHHFSTEPDQYFEAGAMRIPPAKFQKVLIQLIKAMNADPSLPSHMHIDLIEYYFNSAKGEHSEYQRQNK